MDKLLPRLTPACAETVLAGFVAIAQSDGPRQIRALRPRVIATYGRLGEFQRREDQLKHGRSLSQPYPDDGMAEYRLRLDPEGQAVLEAILGPLAAPQPSTEHGSDIRTSDQRRADALVEVCRRAAAAGGSAPTTPEGGGGRDDGLGKSGQPDRWEARTGAGTTLTGDLLAPETVRRMACDASIIPAVLGSKSESTGPGPHRAGWSRPSCSWRCICATAAAPSRAVRGHRAGATPITAGTGATAARRDLSNMALLCPRHHTIVHQKGYTATVSTTEVTWHL